MLEGRAKSVLLSFGSLLLGFTCATVYSIVYLPILVAVKSWKPKLMVSFSTYKGISGINGFTSVASTSFSFRVTVIVASSIVSPSEFFAYTFNLYSPARIYSELLIENFGVDASQVTICMIDEGISSSYVTGHVAESNPWIIFSI
jgi:hypothetical protein